MASSKALARLTPTGAASGACLEVNAMDASAADEAVTIVRDIQMGNPR